MLYTQVMFNGCVRVPFCRLTGNILYRVRRAVANRTQNKREKIWPVKDDGALGENIRLADEKLTCETNGPPCVKKCTGAQYMYTHTHTQNENPVSTS